MRITSNAFLSGDVENILAAIARTQGRQGSDDFRRGFFAALVAIATALGIHVEGLAIRDDSRRGGR